MSIHQERLGDQRIKLRTNKWQFPRGKEQKVLSGTRRKVEASKHLSWTFPPQQVPALIAKTMPTINAINYALHSEMVCRGTWQCLSPQKSKKDRTQWNSSRGLSLSSLPLQAWAKYAPGQEDAAAHFPTVPEALADTYLPTLRSLLSLTLGWTQEFRY